MIAKLILFFLFQSCAAVIIRLNDSDYARMPLLFHLDNYEECFVEPEAIYCTAEFRLTSDEPSELLTMIEEYAALPTHYNRTLLRHGYCMPKTCKKFYNVSEMDLRLPLEACVNESLYSKYKLKAVVTDNIDCAKRYRELPIDNLDITVAVICITIVMANLIGSLCDHYLGKKKHGAVVRYLCCFSIFRNYKKLKAPQGHGQDSRVLALKGIHGIRAINTVCVIIAHALMIGAVFNINPQELEQGYENKIFMTVANGTVVMQTFLLMSSFLLVYNWLIHSEKHAISWKMLPQYIIMRWLRLTPSYALILGLTATWFVKLTAGPYWKILVYNELTDCRRSWWKHLLYINNYYYDGSTCMPQAWYLAADTQLYIAAVIIFLICRTSLTRKVVLSLLFVAGMIIPTLHVYYQHLNGTLVLNPEMVMDLFTQDPTFNLVFKRGHTNLSGCVIGIAMGYIIYYWQKAGGDPKKFWKYRYLYWSTLFYAIFVLFCGTIFYHGEQRQPLYVHLLFAALMKPVFGALMGVLVAGLVIQFEGLYRPILEWQPFLYMSRLSYSAYLMHEVVIRMEVTGVIAVHKIEILRGLTKLWGLIISSFIAAFFLWLLVEAPCGNLIQEFYRKTSRKEGNNEAVGKSKKEESEKCEHNKGTEFNHARLEDDAIVIKMGSKV